MNLTKITLSLLTLILAQSAWSSVFVGTVTKSNGIHWEAKGHACTYIVNDTTSTEDNIEAFLVFGKGAQLGEILDFKKMKGVRLSRLSGYDYAMDKVTEVRLPSEHGGYVFAQNYKNHLLKYSQNDEGQKTITVKLKNGVYTNSFINNVPGYYELVCEITVAK